MPHITVKLFPGKTESQKYELADQIAKDVEKILGNNRSSISVAIEDIPSGDWKERVYDPEIKNNESNIFIKPGYTMDEI